MESLTSRSVIHENCTSPRATTKPSLRPQPKGRYEWTISLSKFRTFACKRQQTRAVASATYMCRKGAVLKGPEIAPSYHYLIGRRGVINSEEGSGGTATVGPIVRTTSVRK